MVMKYKMQNNPQLKLMYDKRDEWVPAYFRGTFCAGMSKTQRSESINAVTKIWMGSNTSLYDFAVKFEKMVEGTYERESDEDIRTMNENPQLWSCDPIEAEARKVYTRSVFSLFKKKMKRAIGYRVLEVEKDKYYEVRLAISDIKYEWYNPVRMVVIDCECKGFEYQGLLCPHALEVMRHVQMEPFLPTHYILKRWTRDANANIKIAMSRKIMEGKQCEELESVMLHKLT
jgi:SWIM zinc finger